jgi:hypothetical protein
LDFNFFFNISEMAREITGKWKCTGCKFRSQSEEDSRELQTKVVKSREKHMWLFFF